MSPGRVLCIGGIDPTGGAGLVRDAWTHHRFARELPVAFVVSAWTWQGRGEAARARAVTQGRFEAQLDQAASSSGSLHIKVGLLPDSLASVLVAFIDEREPTSVVVDPVLRASDGGDLGADPQALLRIGGASTLFTPNRAEAEALGLSVDDAEGACLFKLASADDEEVLDSLRIEGRSMEFRRPRVEGPDPRGTGCTLSTAITCGRARGASWEGAVKDAIAFLDAARRELHAGPDGRPHLR